MSDPAQSYPSHPEAILGPDGNPVREESVPGGTNSLNVPALKDVDPPSDVAPPQSLSPLLTHSVPRISIQVFCEASQTAETFQGAADDRRLARAHITVQMGGIPGAVEQFHDAPTTNLIIVECLQSREALFESLARLAEVCDPSTKVVVIGKVNDISMYRELIRQGINEYLVAPLNPIQVIESVITLYVDPDTPPIGRNIVFVGSKGGVGASTLAHNIGWCISEHLNEDTTIVDLDLSFGTTGLDFNKDPSQGVADALTSPDRVDDVLLDRLLVKCTERLSLFTAPGTLDRDFDLDPGAFESVLDIVRKMVPYAIIDLPHVWNAWSKAVILSADEIVLVATPDLASLRNVKNLNELIKLARPNDRKPKLILNQVGIAKRPEIPQNDFIEAIGLDPDAVIPFEPHLFGTAANNGQMLSEVSASAATTLALQDFAARLIGRDAPQVKKWSLLTLFGQGARSA